MGNQCDNPGIEIDSDSDGICRNVKDMEMDEAIQLCSTYGGKVFEPRTQADLDFLESLDEDMFVGVKWDGSSWRYISGIQYYNTFISQKIIIKIIQY